MDSTTSPIKSVLFVCTGNTCRSPMAEGLLKAALPEGAKLVVGSAGVAAMPGQGASSETLTVLENSQARLDGFASRQVDEDVLSQAELIIAMTVGHAEMVKRYFPERASDVRLLTDFLAADDALKGEDVPDPIGMGAPAYQEVAKVIAAALPGIISMTKQGD